ncbi:MAG: hypothetical protein ABI295_02230 [Xanthomarina sp.]
MNSIKVFLFVFLALIFQTAFSQTVEITGRITTNLEAENIHVINKTAQVFTTTNAFGAFKISAKLDDTLQFSSIQHKLKEVVVDANMFIEKQPDVHLEEFTYALDEVVVGRMLTGDLFKDMGQVEGKPITAMQLGIPSYQGKPKTQSERKLNEATTGGGFIPLNPIFNAISGRIKELKNRVKIEKTNDLLNVVRKRLETILFSSETLPETSRSDFFYFCSEDSNFENLCKTNDYFEILEFLKEKLVQYKTLLEMETN